jgi:hypothetical protein
LIQLHFTGSNTRATTRTRDWRFSLSITIAWKIVLVAISTHPSLRMLKFDEIGDENGEEPSSSMKRDRTNAVADMLKVNKQIEEITFDDYDFDQSNWDALFTPKLE